MGSACRVPVREVKTMNAYKPIGVITALALDTDLKDKSGNVISKGLRGTFTVGLRNYIAEGTQRGPDSGLLLTPRIFTFTHSPP
jgi:hypothetical protein